MHDADLGALASRAVRRLIEHERPILDGHGISMWEYVALSALSAAPAPSQLALATRIGYDKTRLIALLDGLARRGLVQRSPGAEDRRAHVISLTEPGARLVADVRSDIHAMEDGLLRGVSRADRATLRALLARLAR